VDLIHGVFKSEFNAPLEHNIFSLTVVLFLSVTVHSFPFLGSPGHCDVEG